MDWSSVVFYLFLILTAAGGAYGVSLDDKYLMIQYALPGLFGIFILVLYLSYKEWSSERRVKSRETASSGSTEESA